MGSDVSPLEEALGIRSARGALAAVAGIAVALVPRSTRPLAVLAGAVVLSRTHGIAARRAHHQLYRDVEQMLEQVIARHRGGLVDRVDDLEDLLALQYSPIATGGGHRLDPVLERLRDRVEERRA